MNFGVKHVDRDDYSRTWYVTEDGSVSTNPLDAAKFSDKESAKEAAREALVENEYFLTDAEFRTSWAVGRTRVFAFDDDGSVNLNQSHKQIVSSKKQIESKLNFDKIADMCDDLDFSTLGYGRDPHGDMIAELDAIEGESGNIEGVEIRFTENDDGQTVIAVYKKDHKVDTMSAKLVDGEISRDDINEAVYDFLEENSQMLNSSRKSIKSSRKISSVRVNELTEQEKDDLYEIEKNEAEEYYNSLDNSDKQMLRARYGIKNVKDYVKFFIVHPNKLSDDYELMHYNVHKTGRSKVESSRKVIKSSKYYVESGDNFVEFDDLREANEAFRQAVENNDSNTTVKIYVDEGYSNKHLKLMRSERGMLAQSHKAIKSSKKFDLTGSEMQELEWRLNSGEEVDALGWTFVKDGDYITAVDSDGNAVKEKFKSMGNFKRWANDRGGSVKSARFMVEDENGEVLGSADTYEEAESLGGAKIVDSESSSDDGGDEFSVFSGKNLPLPEAQFLRKLASSVEDGEIEEDDAVEQIESRKNVNEGYARKILESEREALKSGSMAFKSDYEKAFDPDGNFDSWTEDFVQSWDDPASTVGGEILRAANEIVAQWLNDGGMIGRGHGAETTDAAARYLVEKCDGSVKNELALLLEDNSLDYQEYGRFIMALKDGVETFLLDHPELFSEANDSDYHDWLEASDKFSPFGEVYVEDDDGNKYWLQMNADGKWECVSIDFHGAVDFEIGDGMTGEDVRKFGLDPDAEFADFRNESAGMEYSAEKEDGYWTVTDVRLIDPLIANGETWGIEELEKHEIYDPDGNVVSADDLLI